MPRVYPPIEGRQPSVNISPSLVESVAGFTAGVVSTLVVHPFDVLKTRLQIAPGTTAAPGSSWRVIKNIAGEGAAARKLIGLTGPVSTWVNTRDVTRAFYRGLVPNTIGNSVSWALYFMWYGNIKDLVRQARGGKDFQSSDYFIASGLSGILTAIVTNPIWVVKTRMLSTARHEQGAYKSMSSGISQLYASEGVKGFYRGLLPSLFGVSHGAIQFMAYENLKNHWAKSRPGGKDGLTNFDYLFLSAISKMLAGSITYPYQVVRARLQTYDARSKYNGAGDVVRQVFKNEGWLGFYKGLGPNVVRVLPSTCVTFLVYENVKFYLPRFWHDREHDNEELGHKA